MCAIEIKVVNVIYDDISRNQLQANGHWKQPIAVTKILMLIQLWLKVGFILIIIIIIEEFKKKSISFDFLGDGGRFDIDAPVMKNSNDSQSYSSERDYGIEDRFVSLLCFFFFNIKTLFILFIFFFLVMIILMVILIEHPLLFLGNIKKI